MSHGRLTLIATRLSDARELRPPAPAPRFRRMGRFCDDGRVRIAPLHRY